MKFITNPVAASDKYDERLDVGLLRPMDQSVEAQRLLEAQMAEHAADPSRPPPMPQYDYEFFLPSLASLATLSSHNQAEETLQQQEPTSALMVQQVRSLKRKFDLRTGPLADGNDEIESDVDDADDQGPPAKKPVRFERVRAYESYQQTGDASDAYGDSVVIALHDGDDPHDISNGDTSASLSTHKQRLTNPLQKAAYYYPVVQRTFIRPKRTHGAGIGMGMGMTQQVTQGEEETKIDVIEVKIRDPTREEFNGRAAGGTGGDSGASGVEKDDGNGEKVEEGIENGVEVTTEIEREFDKGDRNGDSNAE